MTESPKADLEATEDFLSRYAPAGPWALTAIRVDKKGIETKTFGPTSGVYLTSWLVEHRDCNIYFHVNTTMRPLTKKAAREDIKSVDWLHVDIDPRAGEDLHAERKRAHALLTTDLPEGVPPPTVIIFSGGGYQAFWKLAEPIQIGGDLPKAEDAKRWNQWLELRFEADQCHNIDRIMRLPGTINIPDARKIKKGRTPALAKLVSFDADRVYPLSAFEQADTSSGQEAAAAATVSTDAKRLDNLDDLDAWNVTPYIKELIRDGEDPKKPKQDNTRSQWLLQVVCGLIRFDVPDELILGIITDPQWKISASVVDKGTGAKAYALKQLEAGHARAESPSRMLAELNKKHAVLDQEGAKCRVLVWDKSELEHAREVPVLQSFTDFKNRYLNRGIFYTKSDGKLGAMPLGKWWLEHSKRRQYTALRFAPDKPAEFDGYLNLWRGFAVEPVQGEWPRFLDNINRIAGNDDASAEYVVKWIAWAFQNPAHAAEVALVHKGKRGAGKGIFGRGIKSVFGQHGLQIASTGHLVGNFNAHMRDCCLLFADEAFAADDKKSEGVLKSIITEPELVIERKGIDIIQTPNRLHIIMASNEDWIVPAGIEERRFAMFDVDPDTPGPGYFQDLVKEIENGGLAAMLFDLLARDLEGWHPRLDVPQTAALEAQKRHGDSPALQWILGILQAGQIGARRPRNSKAPSRTYLSGRRNGSILEVMGMQVPALAGESDQRLTKILKDWGFKKWGSGLENGWTAPSLLAMQSQWVSTVGPMTWDNPDQVDWEEPVMQTDRDGRPF